MGEDRGLRVRSSAANYAKKEGVMVRNPNDRERVAEEWCSLQHVLC
jgi:hypothetical protein